MALKQVCRAAGRSGLCRGPDKCLLQGRCFITSAAVDIEDMFGTARVKRAPQLVKSRHRRRQVSARALSTPSAAGVQTGTGDPTVLLQKKPVLGPLVKLHSAEGNHIFQDTLAMSCLEGSYWALKKSLGARSGVQTSNHEAATLASVLASLGADPRRCNGPGWVREGSSAGIALVQPGVTLLEWCLTAQCNSPRSVDVTLHYADAALGQGDPALFRQHLLAASRPPTALGGSSQQRVVACFDRDVLQQAEHTGEFLPIAAFNPERDLALMVEVTRYEREKGNGPFWVSVEALYDAMLAADPKGAASRGWATLRTDAKNPTPASFLGLPACLRTPTAPAAA